MDAGALLRETRKARGLDQAALARRAGTGQTHVSRIERGDVAASTETLERLMYAMGQRLVMTVEPLSAGNVTEQELRASRSLTAEQRLEEAMELSEFLTGLAADAADQRRTNGS